MSSIVTNRHDVFVLFDVANGNPNGDPDAGNMPRIDPNTNKGIVSDVCLKRKVRNYIEMVKPSRKADTDNGFEILVKQGAVLNEVIGEGIKAAESKLGKDAEKDKKAEEAMKWLCRQLYDVRTFGAVLSTGEEIMKGSAFGQVRGPVQFTFGQSVHSVTPLQVTVTRCAVTKEEDREKERTMGHKYVIPYALYVAKCYVSPVFAEKTGFTQDDLDLFFEALNEMFTHDHSAARGEMIVRGIYDFEHVGTQHPNNAEQNKREARLGCHHSHKLFEGVSVELAKGKSFPESFEDYNVNCTWTQDTLPKGVVLHLRHEKPLSTIRFKA
jgi:CRISPR-associated protein Csd2